jgi:hypothetical protein
MKRIHPHLGEMVALAAMISLATAAGCRSQSGTMPSPFLAPDRVPPPATRTLLPGQAQPYYPGDPLPVMQSAAATPAAAVASTSPAPSPQPAGDSGLEWSAPGAVVQNAPANNMLPTGTLARSNEPAVAVPADDDSLRFAVPPTEPAAIAQAARPMSQEPQPIVQVAAVPQPRSVVPASYNAPLTASLPSPDAGANANSKAQAVAASPWRPPRITQSSAPTTYGAAAGVVPGVPADSQLAPQSNVIDVRLRAVPSPPPETLESTTPRIRLPSYSTSQPVGGSSYVIPASFVVPSAPAVYGTGVQTMQVSALPPSHPIATDLASSPAATISPDGFRPRGSMR